MPSVSERQHRAMEAAAHGRSTLGIPQSVGKEFVAADATSAAGIAFTAPGGEVLFLRRGPKSDHPGEWCLPGGHVEDGETTEQAARREAIEETGNELLLETGPLQQIDRSVSAENVDFSTFRQPVVETFSPVLNDEHTEHVWAMPSAPPSPLHPGVTALLPALAMDEASPVLGTSTLAFDRASVRSYDRDGRLHVAKSNISKAAINEYLGREIPDWRALGLSPDKRYKLLRDPDELEKAAATFKNLPILSRHVPVTADSHQPDLVIGSLGTDVEWKAPYLQNSQIFWTRDAIEAIEADLQKELSSAYHYRADMTPGTFEGEAYDGVMRDIIGNHVALVREGRAGADVVVGDAAIPNIEELFNMSKSLVLTRKGSVALGALMVHLAPKLAQDAKIDLTPILVGVTHKNFKQKRPSILMGIEDATRGKLAQDATIDDVATLIDTLEKAEVAEGADTDPNSGLPVAGKTPNEEDKKAGMDSDVTARVLEFCKGKMGEDDLAELGDLMSPPAQDEDDEDEKDEKKDMPAKDEDVVKKPAMDAAIRKAAEQATANANRIQREIREAERAVRPWVGDLEMAFDSAADVYATALTNLGVDGIKDIHPSAYPALLKQMPKPGERKGGGADGERSELAMDAASVTGFAKRFPNAAKVKQA